MNSSLYNIEIEFPKDKREHMMKCSQMVKNVDKDSEGFKRNQELQNQKVIGYKQLKRIKNFFDNFKGNQKDSEFVLNGGVEMKNWVNNELRRMRESERNLKHNKEQGGMMNQFIKPHSKDGLDNVRPSKEHSKTVDKYNAAVTESLKRINEIMSKL